VQEHGKPPRHFKRGWMLQRLENIAKRRRNLGWPALAAYDGAGYQLTRVFNLKEEPTQW